MKKEIADRELVLFLLSVENHLPQTALLDLDCDLIGINMKKGWYSIENFLKDYPNIITESRLKVALYSLVGDKLLERKETTDVFNITEEFKIAEKGIVYQGSERFKRELSEYTKGRFKSFKEYATLGMAIISFLLSLYVVIFK